MESSRGADDDHGYQDYDEDGASPPARSPGTNSLKESFRLQMELSPDDPNEIPPGQFQNYQRSLSRNVPANAILNEMPYDEGRSGRIDSDVSNTFMSHILGPQQSGSFNSSSPSPNTLFQASNYDNSNSLSSSSADPMNASSPYMFQGEGVAKRRMYPSRVSPFSPESIKSGIHQYMYSLGQTSAMDSGEPAEFERMHEDATSETRFETGRPLQRTDGSMPYALEMKSEKSSAAMAMPKETSVLAARKRSAAITQENTGRRSAKTDQARKVRKKPRKKRKQEAEKVQDTTLTDTSFLAVQKLVSRKRKRAAANSESSAAADSLREARINKRRPWTKEEDALLQAGVERYQETNWKAIADMVPNRTHVQCLQRWRKSLHPGVIKGRWKSEEDEMLLKIVNENLHIKNWGHAARFIPGRTAKQCRERYTNHLDPDIKKGNWTEDEDKLIAEGHKRLGNKWAEIASHLPGRTENSVKIRAKCIKRKEEKKQRQLQAVKPRVSSASQGNKLKKSSEHKRPT